MSPLKRITGKPATAKFGAAKSAAAQKSQRATGKRTAKRGWINGAIAAVAIVGLGIWIVAHFGRDTRMSELADLRAKLLDPSLSPQDRQDTQDEIRGIQQSLAPEIQKKAAGGAAAFTQLMSAHVKQVLALPEDQRMAAVDHDIDMMRSMGTMFGGRGPQQPNGQNAGGRAGGWGGRGSNAQRNAFRNLMLSSIPAETRAQFQIYMQLVQVRTIQRGM